MNIKITYNWLREYLDTDADAYELQKYLSLCGPGIERIDEVADPGAVGDEKAHVPKGKDYVMDIEVTSNRVDMASVFGIAQEAVAIFPQFGKIATLRTNPLQKYTFDTLQTEPHPQKELHIQITEPTLCPRFTSIIYSDLDIKPAPEWMRRRLEWCDIRSINVIVDISNYLMLSLGQPTHMFDYDKIGQHTMIVRPSRVGEKVTTLDGKELILPGNDIVIEDGDGRIIDLCGIMGGENSAINLDTRTVVFFVQTYNKRNIRKTSMITGQRSMAATYFEKGLDPGRVENTFAYGVELLNTYTNAVVDSQLIDIYPHPVKSQSISVHLQKVSQVMGIEVPVKTMEYILESLGFGVEQKADVLHISVPTYRHDDIKIPEDIIEEIARVYGYHNLPNSIQPTVFVPQPKEVQQFFFWQNKVKLFLKHLGLHEVMNYSMISKELIDQLDLSIESHLKLKNTISEEIEYMRTSLLPSLIKNIKENQGRRDSLQFFELAKIYPKIQGELPNESRQLAVAVNSDFFSLKGIVEGLLRELHISDYTFSPAQKPLYSPNLQTTLMIGAQPAGTLGELNYTYQDRLQLKKAVYMAELEFAVLMQHARTIPVYQAPSPYSVIKLDLTYTNQRDLPFSTFVQKAKSISSLLQKIEYISQFKNKTTLRLYFAASDRNITEEEAKVQYNTICKVVDIAN